MYIPLEKSVFFVRRYLWTKKLRKRNTKEKSNTVQSKFRQKTELTDVSLLCESRYFWRGPNDIWNYCMGFENQFHQFPSVWSKGITFTFHIWQRLKEKSIWAIRFIVFNKNNFVFFGRIAESCRSNQMFELLSIKLYISNAIENRNIF